MFRRLFGETEGEQFSFLQWRVIITLVGAAIGIIGGALSLIDAAWIESVSEVMVGIGGLIYAVMVFIWGFPAIRRLCGFGSVTAIFSGNIVFGVVIFVFCLVLALILSIFVALLGIGRYIYLKSKTPASRR